jgi:hypothetical protein
MSLAVLRIMREHEIDPNPEKTYPPTVPDDAIRHARDDVKRSTIARFMEGALLSILSGEKFRMVPDHMVGLMSQPVSIFINPLPRILNSSPTYVCWTKSPLNKSVS